MAFPICNDRNWTLWEEPGQPGIYKKLKKRQPKEVKLTLIINERLKTITIGDGETRLMSFPLDHTQIDYKTVDGELKCVVSVDFYPDSVEIKKWTE